MALKHKKITYKFKNSKKCKIKMSKLNLLLSAIICYKTHIYFKEIMFNNQLKNSALS